MAYIRKRREECVLLLDEGFSAESVAAQLRTAGFTVQRFHEWFKDEEGNTRIKVPDAEIIRFCHKHGWLLLTRDHEMKNLHREDIRKSEVAILATANNKAEDQREYVISLINMKSRILREFRKMERPWFGTFTRSSTMKIEVIK